MSDENSVWFEVLRAGAASATVAAAVWGAAGGFTSAVVVRVPVHDALRQIVAGAMVAAGVGSGAGTAIVLMVGADPALIPILSAGSLGSYVAGVIGPAVIELVLSRLKSGQLPGDKGDT